MTSAVRESGVPSRIQPTASDARGRSCRPVGTGWDSRLTPVLTARDESSTQLSGRTYTVPPTRPLTPRSDIPGRVLSGGQTWGPTRQRTPRPAALVILRERRQRAEHRPPRFLLSCHGDGVGHGGAEADTVTPVPLLKRTYSVPVGRGLSCRMVCLAAGKHRQKTRCRREACALADNWCLRACLSPTTAVRRPSRRRCRAGAQGGLPPATALVRGHYPRGTPE
jgi:hypothetical protein